MRRSTTYVATTITLIAALVVAQPTLPTNTVESVSVSTNGVLAYPTNFFRANTNELELLLTELGFFQGDGTPGIGTVTSVGISMPASLFDVAGSPVTTDGSITVSLASQFANAFLAGPANGAAAAPVFRAIIDADIPSGISRDDEAAALYQPLDSDLSAYSALSGAGLVRRTGAGMAEVIELNGDTNLFVRADGTLAAPPGSGGVANITTNGSSAGNPVTLQPDLSLATTNVLTVSTQNVDVLVLKEPLSISNGGTGTNSAAAALANLGGQPLDADLTALANGTAIPTAMSNAVSVGAPTLYVGTTNVAGKLAEIETIAGGSSAMSWDIGAFEYDGNDPDPPSDPSPLRISTGRLSVGRIE